MKLFFFLNLCSIVAVFGYVRLFKGAFHLEKKTEISVGAKVEFPIGKKFVPFGRKPGTSRCQTILFSEYEPLNKYLLLLITSYLPINPRPGHSRCKSASTVGTAKKHTVH